MRDHRIDCGTAWRAGTALIRERYMKHDDVFDYKVYNHILEPPVSKDTYTKIRTRAFYKLALALADRGLLKLNELEKAMKSTRS